MTGGPDPGADAEGDTDPAGAEDAGDDVGRLSLSPDEVAGIVDLFGALTAAELEEALAELAYRRGVEPPADAVEDAKAAYALVAVGPGAVDGAPGDALLAVGPAAFPELPEGAEDLPHLLDADERRVDRAALAAAVEERFRGDAARAVAAGEAAELRRLLDASYEIEAWGPVDLGAVRDRLDDALDG
ncbi:MAG: hypothetical protein ABEI11_02885 [Haloarculaceae archaeon]